MEPAPAWGSPPLTDQVTEAASPLLRAAENCSTACPEVLRALQPVQLVSIAAVPGETESVPLDEVDEPDADPPQPASKTNTGTAMTARMRAGQRPGTDALFFVTGDFEPLSWKGPSARRLGKGKRRSCGSDVIALP